MAFAHKQCPLAMAVGHKLLLSAKGSEMFRPFVICNLSSLIHDVVVVLAVLCLAEFYLSTWEMFMFC